MTTTAHEDQFTTGTQTIEPVRQPYDTASILRRNVADAEKEMQRQAERAESYAEAMRSLASYVGAGGYNADTVDAGVFEEKIRWGIGEIIARMEKAEAELAKLAQQKPVMKYMGRRLTPKDTMESWGIDCDVNVQPEMGTPLYTSPVHPPHKGATHCDDCGLTWLDDGLNPLRCPYCKDAVPAPAVPDWNVNIERIRDVMHMLGISIEESVECFSAALPTNINRMTLAMKRHLQGLAGMTAATAPSVPQEWREVMSGLVGIAEAKGKKHGSPNHSHSRPGIWDDDNIRNGLAGKPCAECAMYDRARALLQSAEVRDD